MLVFVHVGEDGKLGCGGGLLRFCRTLHSHSRMLHLAIVAHVQVDELNAHSDDKVSRKYSIEDEGHLDVVNQKTTLVNWRQSQKFINEAIEREMDNAKLMGFPKVIRASSRHEGQALLLQSVGLASLTPNSVVIQWSENLVEVEDLMWLLNETRASSMALMVIKGVEHLADRLNKPTTTKSTIDVWWIYRTVGLQVLVGHLLRRNPKVCSLRLFIPLRNEEFAMAGKTQLKAIKLLKSMRFRKVEVHVVPMAETIGMKNLVSGGQTFKATDEPANKSHNLARAFTFPLMSIGNLRDIELSEVLKNLESDAQAEVPNFHRSISRPSDEAKGLLGMFANDAGTPGELNASANGERVHSPTLGNALKDTLTPASPAPGGSSGGPSAAAGAEQMTAKVGDSDNRTHSKGASDDESDEDEKAEAMHIERVKSSKLFGTLMTEHSGDAELVIIQLPLPTSCEMKDPGRYRQLINALTGALPRVLLINPTGKEVVTQQSLWM